MKRSPMNRGSGAGLSRSAPMKRSKPLAQRSKKQARVYAGDAAVGIEGRRDFVARILGERSACEACARIDLLLGAHARAPHRATEVHEILRRSAGGSVVDDSNVAAVCRRAHAWIHEHPKEARDLGLLRSRYSQPAASENR
jgi:hypothetical protein